VARAALVGDDLRAGRAAQVEGELTNQLPTDSVHGADPSREHGGGQVGLAGLDQLGADAARELGGGAFAKGLQDRKYGEMVQAFLKDLDLKGVVPKSMAGGKR